MDWSLYEKNCYLLARSEKEYLADGSFNGRVEKLIAGLSAEDYPRAVALMEKMISYAPEYYEAEKRYAPILIYKSEPICYGILNHFADCMRAALEELGETTEVFDGTARPLDELRECAKKPYKAVLGIQSYFFSIRLVSGTLLHDYFRAPLFNMLFDHPAVMHEHWIHAPQNLTVLTHDRNYLDFLRRYYADKVRATLLPPGGEGCGESVRKSFDLTFVGTCRSWRNHLQELKELNRRYKGLARKLIYEMKRHPNDTYEVCFEKVAAARGETYDTERLREQMHEMQKTYLVVSDYYRERILYTLLDAGIRLDVFGDSWNAPGFFGYPNLIRHPELSQEECLKAYAASRLSLNIMTWHKAGMTERIANMLLCRTVVVTDKSAYLEEHFCDGADMVFFDLEHLEALPDKIRRLLADGQKQTEIAEAGYEKAREGHTWRARAEQLLTLIEQHTGA